MVLDRDEAIKRSVRLKRAMVKDGEDYCYDRLEFRFESLAEYRVRSMGYICRSFVSTNAPLIWSGHFLRRVAAKSLRERRRMRRRCKQQPQLK